MDATRWHALSVEAALERVASSPAGLTGAEAAARRARDGPNALARDEGVHPLALLLHQFRNLLVALLLVAALVAFLVGEWLDAGVILGIVVLNAAIGFAQEWRAETALAALRRMTAPRARVRRDGAVVSLPAVEIARGDVVLLEAGDLVPADLRLLQASSLLCSEAALTGESEAVEKSVAPLAGDDLPLGDRANLAFMGTSVVAGAGAGVVVAVGMTTELGRIAHLISEAAAEASEQTPLERRLQGLGRALVWSCLAIVALLFGAGLARGLPPLELLMTAVSLAVAAVPEGLPAVATVALALGVARMARRRVWVRRLPAVETLGSVSVICSDKTGTLTQGAMAVRELRAASPGSTRELLESFVACTDAELSSGIGDPTELALLRAGAESGILRDDIDARTPRVREWPFDSTRKRMSVARRSGDARLRVDVKGALEQLLPRCDRIAIDGAVRALTEADRTRIAGEERELAERALRVLGAARRELSEPEAERASADEVERDLVFLGLVGMHDPPRLDARASVARCRAAGIRVVMITGDHPRTALAVARELGIASAAEEVLSGAELDARSDAQLREQVAGVSVYARVTAADKLRIVRAWQARGAVVAMTGDGVNDAPAIRGADIGIAMGGAGTEVTKQASAMILRDDDFASIVAAVEEGRGIFGNIRKTIQYLLAGNSAELLVMSLCIAFGYPAPLLPVQLLWINLVTDGLPALCLATDPIDAGVMERPPRPRNEAIADRATLVSIAATGLSTALVTLGVFAWSLETSGLELARSDAFAVLVFAELLRSFGVRSATLPTWRIDPWSNARLTLVVAGSFALQIAGHHVEPLRLVLGTSMLPWSTCGWLLLVALVPAALVDLAKVLRARTK